MSEFLFFMIGITLGGMGGAVCMCCLQIHRLSKKEDEDDAKKGRSDTFSSE